MTNTATNKLGTVAVILLKDETAELGVKEVTVWSEQCTNYEDLWIWLNTPTETSQFKTVHIADDYFSVEFKKDDILHFYEIDYFSRKQTDRSKNS